jgi:hypothetical protein
VRRKNHKNSSSGNWFKLFDFIVVCLCVEEFLKLNLLCYASPWLAFTLIAIWKGQKAIFKHEKVLKHLLDSSHAVEIFLNDWKERDENGKQMDICCFSLDSLFFSFSNWSLIKFNDTTSIHISDHCIWWVMFYEFLIQFCNNRLWWNNSCAISKTFLTFFYLAFILYKEHSVYFDLLQVTNFFLAFFFFSCPHVDFLICLMLFCS